jgi:hypothetical protein
MILAEVRHFRQALDMIFSPPRAQILASVQRADFNLLACRVARSLADYEFAFDAEGARRSWSKCPPRGAISTIGSLSTQKRSRYAHFEFFRA